MKIKRAILSISNYLRKMNKVFWVFLLFSLTVFSANCGTDAVENTEADLNANVPINLPENTEQNNNRENANTDSGEVPKYDDAETALAEGNKFLDDSENDKAIDAYRQAVELNPELADAHFRLGVALALIEREEQVTATPDEEETPEKGKKKNSKKDEAEKTPSQKAFQNAVNAYEKIIKKDKENDQAFFNLGRAYSKLNEDKDALKALQTAVKLKPDDSDYQTELGEIYIKLAQYDEAVRALKKAIEIDENNLIAEDLLEQAQAGKKRVDFGANLIKQKIKVETNP